MIRSTVYIHASPKLVFAAMTDFARYREWTPGCEGCTVVSTSGSRTDIEIILNAPRRARLGVRYEAEGDQLLRFEMTSGRDLNKYAGLYRLEPAADGKGTVLFTELELELKALPRFLTDGMAKKSLDQAGAALKRYVERLPAGNGQASAAPTAALPAPRTPRRPRRLLQIVKEPNSYRIWFMGRTLRVKDIPDWPDGSGGRR